MNIVITNSKMQYKANDGGVTRRIPEHFKKRTVVFEVDGEERRIFIDKDQLPREVSEEDIVAYIEDNFDDSTLVNEKYEQLKLEQAQANAELIQLIMTMSGGVK